MKITLAPKQEKTLAELEPGDVFTVRTWVYLRTVSLDGKACLVRLKGDPDDNDTCRSFQQGEVRKFFNLSRKVEVVGRLEVEL